MKSAYTSKFYLEQPKYASLILFPQIMSSLGKHSELDGKCFSGSEQECITGSGKGVPCMMQRSLACRLPQDAIHARGWGAQSVQTPQHLRELSELRKPAAGLCEPTSPLGESSVQLTGVHRRRNSLHKRSAETLAGTASRMWLRG